MLNQRRKEIIHYLIDTKSTIYIKNLQSLFDVSERTIRYDMRYIREWLKVYNLHLVHQAGKGAWTIKSDNSDVGTLQKIKEALQYQAQPTAGERVLLITHLILMKSNWITLRELAEELDVSRATILTSINDTEKWLGFFSLQLTRSQKGFAIVGSERNKRIALISILEGLEYYWDTTNPILSLNWSNITYNEMKWLEENIHNKHDPNLFIVIALLVERIRSGNNLENYLPLGESIRDTDIKTSVSTTLKILEKKFSLNFSRADQAFVCQYLYVKSNEIHVTKEEIQNDSNFLHFISSIENRLGISIKGSKYKETLFKEWRKLEGQLKYDIVFVHPIFDTLKERYPLLALHVRELVIGQINPEVTENHLVPLMIQLAIIYEQTFESKSKHTIWVVCPKGIATSQLLAITLRKYLPQLKIGKVLATDQITKNKEGDNPDFIVSTVSLVDPPYPYIMIKPILTQKEMDKITNFLSTIKQYNNNAKDSKKSLNLLIPQKRIIKIENKDHTLEYLIRQGVNLLLNDNMVEMPFFDDIWEVVHDKGHLFEVVPGILFAHAKSQHVNKPGFSLVQLKHPFRKKDIEANAILFMATPDTKSHIPQLEYLHQLLTDPEETRKLRYATFNNKGETTT